MKTFQQFCEDAASDYEAGMRAYKSSAPARLAARREAANIRSRTAASSFKTKSLENMQRQRKRQQEIRKKYQKRQAQADT